MASNENVIPYHLLQASFATGEISKEVANRVDLDKYQAALTKAVNCLIRPYGPVYKRPGTKYMAECKENSIKNILQSFTGTDNKDFLLEIGAYTMGMTEKGYIRIYKKDEETGGIDLQGEIETPYLAKDLRNLRFTQSADTMFIACGEYPLRTLKRNANNWECEEYKIEYPYFDDSLGDGSANCQITPSGKSGNITLTATEDIFFSGIVGGYIRLKQDVASNTVSKSGVSDTGTSSSIYAGESWKIITHGTWAGTIKVQYSVDNSTWKDYRTYTGKSDYNATESGSLSEGKYLRIYYNITSGSATIDLTALTYVEEGYVKVTGYINAKAVSATVVKNLGTTDSTKQWAFSAWNSYYGYPNTVAFFQDRLCLGGSKKQPYMLWMSRTGDYNNFSVDKADGKVTDDSAVALSLVSRKQFVIRHLVPNTDLLILTQGNEWALSGNEIITPSSATPKMQTTRGCGNIEPIMIGSKTVFVQGRGSVVRDMGYSYETDSYGGMDLTLLDKSVVAGHELIDATYMQEPNSAIYFVREDGKIAVLTYVIDQKVYAWSTFETADGGAFESISAVAEGDIDAIYVVVVRNGKRYIEQFQGETDSTVPNDFIRLDCASVIESNEASTTLNAPQLANCVVTVLGDGRQFENIMVEEDGTLILPTSVKNAIVGLPYNMQLELPNVEIKGRDGTMQGRFKDVSEVILRLDSSLGGFVGPNIETLDEIHYDEFQDYANVVLYSGDKRMQIPIGGFNTEGRINIESNDAYPFNLLAVVRVVTLGG